MITFLEDHHVSELAEGVRGIGADLLDITLDLLSYFRRGTPSATECPVVARQPELEEGIEPKRAACVWQVGTAKVITRDDR